MNAYQLKITLCPHRHCMRIRRFEDLATAMAWAYARWPRAVCVEVEAC